MKPRSTAPNQPGRVRYITAGGERALREELNHLLRVKRPQVTEAVREAAALGDRSENAEYIYGKKQLREIDRRIRFLTKRLESVTVVDRLPPDQTRIFFGAWVRIEDEEGEERELRIVGGDEIHLDERYISIDAPLARALLKRMIDDEVKVRTPAGTRHYYVTGIRYEQP